MATAFTQQICCVRSASGVDSGVFEAFVKLPAKIAPGEMEQVIGAVEALPGVVEAIDTARYDPDNLYLTVTTQPGRDEALWPGSRAVIEMRSGQCAAPNVSLDCEGRRNLLLSDDDKASRDDHLKSIMIDAIEAGQGVVGRLTSSQVEGSASHIIDHVL
jgi:hypothetical protein